MLPCGRELRPPLDRLPEEEDAEERDRPLDRVLPEPLPLVRRLLDCELPELSPLLRRFWVLPLVRLWPELADWPPRCCLRDDWPPVC